MTGRSSVQHSVSSPDGTVKFLLRLADGRTVETVRPLLASHLISRWLPGDVRMSTTADCALLCLRSVKALPGQP